MMEPVKIVAHYRNGQIVKGYSQDFNVNRPFFRLYSGNENPSSSKQIEIQIKDLKAVFFVKTHEDNSEYCERKGFVETDKFSGRKVEITFFDGEKMQGSTLGYSAARSGFFLFPSDPDSNNMRIFVVNSALTDFRFL